jgi:WD40 repeat protein
LSVPAGGQQAEQIPATVPAVPAEHAAKHDVFVSYNRKDSVQVRLLAELLQERKLIVWFDRTELLPGDPDFFMDEIAKGMRSSSSVVVVRGPHGVGPVQAEEVALARVLRHEIPGFRLIVVVLPGGKPEDLDKSSTYVEFRESFVEEDTLDTLVAGILGEAPRHGPALPDAPAPYRALSAFGIEDRRFFFGRRAEIARMRESLARHPFLAVLGASGSGKTSLVQAGFLGELQAAAPAGSPERPRSILVHPGSHPLRSLATNLVPLHPGDPLRAADDLHQRLSEKPDDLPVVLQTLHTSPERLVLVVDRLEELFTLCEDTDERLRFICALVALARASAPPAWAVATMRADFYGHLTRHAELADQVEQHQLLLTPLSDEGVRDIVVQPLALVHGLFERGLDDQVAEDAKVNGEVALPLLEYTLDLLWRERHGVYLTWDAYRTMGRVPGALSHQADAAIATLDAGEREVARRILLSLIWLGEGLGRLTGRRVRRAELVEQSADARESERVLQRLADQRLIVIDTDRESSVVTLVHDTLPVHWDLLKRWVQEDREFLLWRERLRPDVEQYVKNPDRDLLLRGAPLVEAKAWLDKRGRDLTRDETEFIRESVRLRTRRGWLRRGAMALGTLALVAVLLEGWQSWTQARRARSSGLVTGALVQLPLDTELSFLLAREAVRIDPSPEAQDALRHALVAPHVLQQFVHSGKVHSALFSADGHFVVTASQDKTAIVWDVKTGKQTRLISEPMPVYHADLSPDGKHIVTAGPSGARMWSVDDGKLEGDLPGHTGDVLWATFSPDGERVLTAGRDGTLRLWNASTRVSIKVMPIEGVAVRSAAFSPDGRRAVTANQDGTARIWDVESGKEIGPPLTHDGPVQAATFSPDGTFVVTAGPDAVARVWDLSTRRVVRDLRGHLRVVKGVAYSADGRLIATASEDGTSRIWSADTGQEIVSLRGSAKAAGNSSPSVSIESVAFSRDGRRVVTARSDGAARVWEVANEDGVQRLDGHTSAVRSASFSADGERVVTASTRTARRRSGARKAVTWWVIRFLSATVSCAPSSARTRRAWPWLVTTGP